LLDKLRISSRRGEVLEMPVIESRVDVNGGPFQQNREGMLKLVEEWRAVEARGRAEEESKRGRYHKRGQMLPRERVHLMLDRGSPWLELSTLAGYKQHDDKDGSLAGGNQIAGIGYVSGVRCLVGASNSAIKGGTITPWGSRRACACRRSPCSRSCPACR
jgi:geranyl-CoA carboxylase beta subunit